MISRFHATGVLEWTEDEIKNLHVQICRFKRQTPELFATYHPPDLRTWKGHGVEHIPDDLTGAGTME